MKSPEKHSKTTDDGVIQATYGPYVGVLPEVKYVVKWPDLFELSSKEQAEVSKTKMEALKAYQQATNPVTGDGPEEIVDPQEMRELIGFEPRSEEEIEELRKKMEEEELDEDDEQVIEQFSPGQLREVT